MDASLISKKLHSQNLKIRYLFFCSDKSQNQMRWLSGGLMLNHCLQGSPNNNMINPYSAGIDFRRQILTSVDVRIWRLKSIPALEE